MLLNGNMWISSSVNDDLKTKIVQKDSNSNTHYHPIYFITSYSMDNNANGIGMEIYTFVTNKKIGRSYIFNVNNWMKLCNGNQFIGLLDTSLNINM